MNIYENCVLKPGMTYYSQLTIVHKAEKTNKLYYTGDDPRMVG